MFLRMIQWLRSLYPRQISSFCFGFCWALPRSLLLCCFALWRNANLAGGFAGRFWLRFCFVPHVSYTLLLFTAYAIVRTVPSANRPNRREKKVVQYLPVMKYPKRRKPYCFLIIQPKEPHHALMTSTISHTMKTNLQEH